MLQISTNFYAYQQTSRYTPSLLDRANAELGDVTDPLGDVALGVTSAVPWDVTAQDLPVSETDLPPLYGWDSKKFIDACVLHVVCWSVVPVLLLENSI